MRYVKNLAGLAIVLLAFVLALLVSLSMVIFAFMLFRNSGLSLFGLLIMVIGIAGTYVVGNVLWLFARNFSLAELMSPDHVASRDDAPVALEIRYDKSKSRSYLVDSRRSPRATNPKKLGRGVFIMQRKRGSFMQDRSVITLIDAKGSNITSVRNFGEKIHFEFKDKNSAHTAEVTAVTEHTCNFERKQSWDPVVGGPDVSKEKLAEMWVDSLKKDIQGGPESAAE